jgi:hypothetical protein
MNFVHKSTNKKEKIVNQEGLIVNPNDEYYTPYYAIEPIVKYLKPNSTILCPFDKDESLYVKVLKHLGFNVINSHIESGVDFFNIDKDFIKENKIDYIISNPPYSLKNEVLTHLFSLNTPFAMLMGVVGIFESDARFDLFSNNQFEVLYFNRRISYFKSYENPLDKENGFNPPFSSAYFCSNILPKQIVFEKISKKRIVL